MREVHVIGAGGIGVALAWFLARAGWSVTVVDANPRKVAAGRRDGLSVNGAVERGARFEEFAGWRPPERGHVLLCTKTYHNAEVLAQMESRHALIPVQNGFEPSLETSDHPCEGIASFVSQGERDRPATRITRAGALYLGGRRPLSPGEREKLEALAQGLRQGSCEQVRVVDLISPYKSTKLMYNAAISPLAAAAGVDNGHLLGDALAQRLFFALLRENYGILHRGGVRLARVGPFAPWLVNLILRLPGLAPTMARWFRPGLAGTYCSMAPDMGTGHTETAAYNGHLIRLARGQRCPINTAVSEMIGRMEDQNLLPCHARLSELRDALGWGGPA